MITGYSEIDLCKLWGNLSKNPPYLIKFMQTTIKFMQKVGKNGKIYASHYKIYASEKDGNVPNP